MTRLEFYDTDQFDVQTRWEYTVDGKFILSYNCDRESPPLHYVRGKFNDMLTMMKAPQIQVNDAEQPRLVWGYDV